MNSQITISPISSSLEIISHGPIAFPVAIKQTVNKLWKESCSGNPHLFDDLIVCVKSIEDNFITCTTVPYRYFYAQRLQPQLAQQMSLKPLAVTGFISSNDGVVLGIRSPNVTQYPNGIELVPSGTISSTNIKSDGRVDIKNQLLQELEEELGISASSVKNLYPQFLVFDHDENTYDVCIQIILQQGILEQYVKSTTNQEYTEIMIVAKDKLDSFCKLNSKKILPSTLEILRKLF